MKSIIVIPCRHGSTRFPGKPMAEIAGHSMIKRVWSVAKAVEGVNEVFVATDDDRIYRHAESFGAKAVMTSDNCRNGTERVYETVLNLGIEPEFVINLQGDAVLTPPWIIQPIVDLLKKDQSVQIATPAVQLNWERYDALVKSKAGGKPGGTLVTFDRNFKALYFSKNIIPFLRNKEDLASTFPPVYSHIGLYGYRFDSLKKYLSFMPSTLEQAEQLEQLRALENDIPIRIIIVDYRGRTHWSVDSPDDVPIVENIIKNEGELVQLK